MNILKDNSQDSIKIEHLNNACRFCVHNTRNLISLTSKVPNCFEEIGTNVIFTVSELITKCFGFEENPLDDAQQYLCEACLNKFIETYEFRKQCVWALNYWETQYNYALESLEEIEKSTVPPSISTIELEIKPYVPLEEVCVIESKLNKVPKKNKKRKNKGINEENVISSCNNNNIKVQENSTTINEIESKASDNNDETSLSRTVGEKKKTAPRICPYCGIVAISLNIHMLSHTNAKSEFICDFCGKIFKKKCYLYRHTRIHVNVRNQKCTLCKASFVERTSLRVHMLNHTEERKFVCHICSKTFKQSCNLKVHILTHTLEKKIKCDYCDLLFINNANKNKHLQNHQKILRYQCEFCPKKFHSTSYLASHRLTHTKYNPYKCELCESTFIRISEFKAHNRQHKYNII